MGKFFSYLQYFLFLLLILAFLGLIIFVFLFVPPWKGVETNVFYELGETHCIVQNIEHRFFGDIEKSYVYEVFEFDGSYFYKKDSDRLYEIDLNDINK